MYITNKKRSDGFGAQYQTIIFTILFAELLNLEFVYTPFTEMEHNYDNDFHFIEKKESLINIINNFKKITDIDQSKIVNYDLSHIYRTVEDRLDYCLLTDSFKKIKNLFFIKNEKLKNLNNGKTLCIHIRRPNKYDIGDYGYSSNEHYLNVIDVIKQQHKDIQKIKIYSQGEIKDFEKFKSHDVEFNLNLSIEDTFIDLVFSDILVQSKSSLSYCAGLLCDGIVYYTPFWHTPKNNWIKI
jgi:hypothetical protein